MVFLQHVDKYQTTVLKIMILESNAALVVQDLLLGYKHDEFVAFRAIIHDAVPIFCIWQSKYICNVRVVKPDGSKLREVQLCPDGL